MLVPLTPKIKYLDLGTHTLIERSALDRLLDRLETASCAESLLHERERGARETNQSLARRKRTVATRRKWPVRDRKALNYDV